MKEIYVVNCCRTAVGSFGGSLKDTPAPELGAVVVKEALSRAGVEQVLSMGPKRLVLTLAIRFVLYFVQLRIAKVKTSLLGPIDSTCSTPARDRASFTTTAPSSGAGVSFRLPPKEPTAVRQQLTT